MEIDAEQITSEPERIGDALGWKFAARGARALFLGRGAPGRDEAWPETLLPADVRRSWLRQVHSGRVLDARPGLCGEGDALRVERAGLAAVVATADCVPIVVVSERAVAAIHAGWRGLVAGVVGAALERLDPDAEAVAWIGPAIGPCCYEVGEDVASAVVAASASGVCRPGARGRPHLDLAGAAALQLRAAGIGRIQRIAACTRCRPEWLWSHRGDGPGAGRNLAVVWREPTSG